MTILIPEFVESMPEILVPGVLYVSEKYGSVIHLCPCGCGWKSVTATKPFWPDGWDITIDGNFVTLSPSILARYPCKSHYFIRRNEIQWA